MELFTSTQTQHLPQSVLSVKSKNGLNYSSSSGSNPVIDFELAGSIGYYLAEDVVLSFDFEYTSSDGIVYNLRPQNNQSLAGMINQLSIYSLSDGVLLEPNCIMCAGFLNPRMIGPTDSEPSICFNNL